jgi:hypothetical protein
VRLYLIGVALRPSKTRRPVRKGPPREDRPITHDQSVWFNNGLKIDLEASRNYMIRWIADRAVQKYRTLHHDDGNHNTE